MTHLFLDIETGGIAIGNISILKLSLATYRYGKTRIFQKNTLSLSVKPDDGVYKVEAGALRVNNIDLVEHDKEAIPYSQAARKIVEFLKKEMEGETTKLIATGHNIQDFDLGHIFHNILDKRTWNRYVSPHVVDTLGVAKYLTTIGILPEDLSLNQKSLANHLDIAIDEEKLHDADYDIDVCARILFKLRKLSNPEI